MNIIATDIAGVPVVVGDWITLVRACRGVPHCEADIGLTFRVTELFFGSMICETRNLFIRGWHTDHPKGSATDERWIPIAWCKRLDADPAKLKEEAPEEVTV